MLQIAVGNAQPAKALSPMVIEPVCSNGTQPAKAYPSMAVTLFGISTDSNNQQPSKEFHPILDIFAPSSI